MALNTGMAMDVITHGIQGKDGDHGLTSTARGCFTWQSQLQHSRHDVPDLVSPSGLSHQLEVAISFSFPEILCRCVILVPAPFLLQERQTEQGERWVEWPTPTWFLYSILFLLQKRQTGVGERWVANSYMALCPILSLLKARETGLGER